MEKIEIIATEHYADDCLNDSFDRFIPGSRNINARPEGRVEVFEVDDNGKRRLVYKNNLVLYQGREVFAQRIMNIENVNVDSSAAEFISWLGIGDGGVAPADPIDPIAPILTDTDLYSEVPLNGTNSSYGDFRAGNYFKHPFDSVEFEQDVLNDDKWLVIKITTTIGVDDANGEQISEAGLFTSDSTLGSHPGPFHLMARVTFPSIVKTDSRRIVFVWYLYV